MSRDGVRPSPYINQSMLGRGDGDSATKRKKRQLVYEKNERVRSNEKRTSTSTSLLVDDIKPRQPFGVDPTCLEKTSKSCHLRNCGINIGWSPRASYVLDHERGTSSKIPFESSKRDAQRHSSS